MLDLLKHDPGTRHVPIAVFSADGAGRKALRLGARVFVEKPAAIEDVQSAISELTRFAECKTRRLLVVEDDARQQQSIAELIGCPGLELVRATSAQQAMAELAGASFDCIVLDLGLPDMNGLELLGGSRTRVA